MVTFLACHTSLRRTGRRERNRAQALAVRRSQTHSQIPLKERLEQCITALQRIADRADHEQGRSIGSAARRIVPVAGAGGGPALSMGNPADGRAVARCFAALAACAFR
jgi:hypothetical protein